VHLVLQGLLSFFPFIQFVEFHLRNALALVIDQAHCGTCRRYSFLFGIWNFEVDVIEKE